MLVHSQNHGAVGAAVDLVLQGVCAERHHRARPQPHARQHCAGSPHAQPQFARHLRRHHLRTVQALDLDWLRGPHFHRACGHAPHALQQAPASRLRLVRCVGRRDVGRVDCDHMLPVGVHRHWCAYLLCLHWLSHLHGLLHVLLHVHSLDNWFAVNCHPVNHLLRFSI